MPLPTGTNSPAKKDTSSADPFDTALISRFAKEFFSDSLCDSVPGPSRPTALTGIPESLPDASPSIPAPAERPPSDRDIPGGGFPTPSPSAPPVHPIVNSAPAAQAKPDAHHSGAHDPASRHTYPFGEPRCKGTRIGAPGQSDAPGEPANSRRSNDSYDGAIPTPALNGLEVIETPDFYFLKKGGTSADRTAPANISPSSSLTVFDIEAIRRDFPALQQRVNGHPLIWMDNAATTQKPQSVIEATSHFYRYDNSNIHRAAHTISERATQAFEAGREKVRQFLGAGDKKEIVFLRGTTEAINLVAQSYGRQNIGKGDEIILSELEHHANIVPWQLLAEQVGAVIRVIPINDRGELILEEYVKLLGPRTKIVSVAHVSNSLGTVNSIEEIIPLAHARGVPVLVDGAQSTPHLPVNVSALDVDFYAFSGHKVFGPTGIGALYGKSHLLDAMPPYQGGGHMIQDVSFERTIYRSAPEKFEAGTPDIVGVVGLGAAIDYLTNLGLPAIAAYEHSLLEYATDALATVPGLRPIGTAQNKASVLSFVIPGISNDQIADHLDKHGIAVRAGHHCALPAQRHFGQETTVRPSLAFYNTHHEVDELVRVLHLLPRH